MDIIEGDRVYKITNKIIDKNNTYKIIRIIPYDTSWYDGYFIETRAIAINENTNNQEELLILLSSHLQNYYEVFLVKI